MKAPNKIRAATALLSVALLLQGCVVGPRYHRPTVQTPGTFKEVTPEDLKRMDGWKVAQPQDSALHGKWWEILGDPQLNALEERVDIPIKTSPPPSPASWRRALWCGKLAHNTFRLSPRAQASLASTQLLGAR